MKQPSLQLPFLRNNDLSISMKTPASIAPVHPVQPRSAHYRFLLALTALGVVYGDIGTSPLYALREAFQPEHQMAPVPENIFGLLSLIFWSLTIVISVKYLIFILRADNKGEGGILALTSLVAPQSDRKLSLSRSKNILVLIGLFGTSLLYGDGMITPAISILSAVEGLSLITPVLEPYVLPLTVMILILLFSIQKKGTGTVGKFFGPVTFLWFLVLGILGVRNILLAPVVLQALNPLYVFRFFAIHAWQGFIVLGSVFLVVTGGEALYSDLGHFGRKPIQQAWFFVALPGLVLNYLGQGALLIQNPLAVSNPFFLMAPNWALVPLVVLAALATTMASQALITGVFSMTMQAVQNGYLPRLQISHTSQTEYGQIYIQSMNQMLMIGCIGLVLIFRSSSHLASAYGLAVTTTMVITSVLFYFVAREKWGWSLPKAGLLCGLFLSIDLAFWGANLLKLIDGGWVPLLIGVVCFTVMTTWRTGRHLLLQNLQAKMIPLTQFLSNLKTSNIQRVEGTAIYLCRHMTDTPYALIHTYEHFKTAHSHLIFLIVLTEEVPQILESHRVSVESRAENNFHVTLHYGYMEVPDLPRDLEGLRVGEIILEVQKITFIIGRENIFATSHPGMAIWREKLFSLLSKNKLPATDYFQLPKDRVIEIGVQIAL